MKPSARRLLTLMLSKEWVSGNEMFEAAGTRYGARLADLKELGYTWDKRPVPGSAVPMYRIHPPRQPERHSKRPAVAPGQLRAAL
jgi:hypothetical protein